MTAEKHLALETALKEYVESVTEQEEAFPVVIDWIIGYTVSGIVETDEGGKTIAYANGCVRPDNNPNSQVTLAAWVAESIMDYLRSDE